MSRRYFQNIEFKDCGPKIGTEKIAEFEVKIGSKLPEDFRKFLCEINGGIPEKQGFRCVGDSVPKNKTEQWIGGRHSNDNVFLRKKFSPRMIVSFWSFDTPKIDCILKMCGKIRVEQDDTRSLIPFGETKLFHDEWIQGGNIALSVHKNHFGFIYCVEPTERNKQQILAELKNFLVAKSFSEFLTKLAAWHDGMIFRP